MKYLAFYFPQFHRTPENDAWWGEGFTDWKLVREARPLVPGQRQPRQPLGENYYDLSDPAIVAWQAELAEAYGLYGFNFYHYWFDGRLILEQPVEHFRRNQQHNLKYCLTWANENWTRQWIGSSEVLLRQAHLADRDIWRRHFDYLLPYFNDSRYLRMDGKPVFCLYRPELNPALADYVSFFNEQAAANGLSGVFFIGMQSYSLPRSDEIYGCLDGRLRFQPRYLFNTALSQRRGLVRRFESVLRALPEQLQLPLITLWQRFAGSAAYDYELFNQCLIALAREDDADTLQSLIVDWDNTARYGERARFFQGSTPERFGYWLEQLTEVERQKGREYIFINAWNEWSECAYLEPDTEYGYQYLEQIRRLSTR